MVNYRTHNGEADGELKLVGISKVNWKIALLFDKKINRIEAYQGKNEKCDGVTCEFENENWNGNTRGTNELTLGFKAHFRTGNNPKVVSFSFNGKQLYGPSATNSVESTSEIQIQTSDVPLIDQKTLGKRLTINFIIKLEN